MEQNVGNADRIGRIVVGLVVLLVGLAALTGYWGAGTAVGVVGLIVGLVLVVTGVTRSCLVYDLLGIRTDR